jgi:diketogulonate reductase-like aldo/keto reductase
MIEYKEFGRAKVKVSAIGMGTFFDMPAIIKSRILSHHKNESQKVAALKKGIELGINLIDTAEVYNTETIVAKAIKDFKRDELFIATKVYPLHLRYDQVLKAAQWSMSRLQTPYIDLYQIHVPNPLISIRETMRAMERLVDEGKIRYIGVSNFSLSRFTKAEEALSNHEIISIQNAYNLAERKFEERLLPYCSQNNIAVLAYRPLAHGKLARPSPGTKEVLNKISKKYGGKTPAQIALNWLLTKSKNVFPIPRASTQERVIENIGAMGWNLEPEETNNLENAVL